MPWEGRPPTWLARLTGALLRHVIWPMSRHFGARTRGLRSELELRALAIFAFTLGIALPIAGCPASRGGERSAQSPRPVEPRWPNGLRMSFRPLPAYAWWRGVYVIDREGMRGTMHLFTGAENKLHGCWLAEDKH